MIKLTRPKTVALIGIACGLLIIGLWISLPFGDESASPSGQSSAGPAQSISPGSAATLDLRLSTPDAQILRFPSDRSIGTISVREWNSPNYSKWEEVGQARGEIMLSAGKEIKLDLVDLNADIVSALRTLPPEMVRAISLKSAAQVSQSPDLTFLRRFTHLKVLWLQKAGITDEQMAHVSQLTSLRSLDLGYNPLTDAGAVQIGNLTSLQDLYLGGIAVSEPTFAALANLASLRELYVQSNKVTDDALAHLSGLSNLQELVFSMPRGSPPTTPITDRGVKHLSGLSSLHLLGLGHTNVTQSGIITLQRSLPQCQIIAPSSPVTPTPQAPIS